MENCQGKKHIKRLLVNRWVKIGFTILLSIVILIMGYMILSTQKYHKFTQQKYTLYSYDNSAKVNYEVFLIPNQLYSEKSLKEGKVYITSFVDYLDTNFTYEYNSEIAGKVNGKYNVSAVLEGYLEDEKGSKTLWKKEYELLPEKNFNGNDKIVTVQSKIPVNIKEYNAFVEKISEATGFNCNTRLTIMWNTEIEVKTDKKTINEKLTPTIEIPLNTKYFEIKGNLTDEKKGTAEETRKVISSTYNKKISIYGTVAGLCVVMLLFLIFLTTKMPELNLISKRRNKIFKEHGSRMVASYNDFADFKANIIEVFSIDDLVRIADDIGRPILYKNSGKTDEINNFYVIDEGNIYMLDIRKGIEEEINPVSADPMPSQNKENGKSAEI